MLNVSWHELLSWGLVLISATLFIHERRINNKTKYFMMLQGILQATKHKAQLYAHLQSEIKNNPTRDIPVNEYKLLVQTVYSDHKSLMQHIMGSMKSLDPNKETSFNVDQFLNDNEDNATK